MLLMLLRLLILPRTLRLSFIENGLEIMHLRVGVVELVLMRISQQYPDEQCHMSGVIYRLLLYSYITKKTLKLVCRWLHNNNANINLRGIKTSKSIWI